MDIQPRPMCLLLFCGNSSGAYKANFMARGGGGQWVRTVVEVRSSRCNCRMSIERNTAGLVYPKQGTEQPWRRDLTCYSQNWGLMLLIWFLAEMLTQFYFLETFFYSSTFWDAHFFYRPPPSCLPPSPILSCGDNTRRDYGNKNNPRCFRRSGSLLLWLAMAVTCFSLGIWAKTVIIYWECFFGSSFLCKHTTVACTIGLPSTVMH